MPADFEFTVKTDNEGTSADDQFTLPLSGSGTYDCVIGWGDGSAPEVKNTNTSITHTFLGGAGTYAIAISGVFPRIYFNNVGDKLKLLSVEQLGEVGWTLFAYAFYGCSNMTSFISGTADISLVTSMLGMFYYCSSLSNLSVSGLDTTLVTNMQGCFSVCSSLVALDISSWDTAFVVNADAMFYGCSLLDVDVSNFDITLMTTAIQMFSGSGFGQRNYDKLLVVWEAQVEQAGVKFHAGSAQYSPGAPTVAKAALEDNGWTITDGGQGSILPSGLLLLQYNNLRGGMQDLRGGLQ